jgi:hypothetical protein
MSTSYGAPRAGRIVKEMKMGHPADMPPGVTGYLEPGAPTPPASVVADTVEQVKDPGLLARIWSIIQAMGDDFGKTTSTGEFPSGYEVAQTQTMGDKVNKWLSDVPEAAFDDIGTVSETRRTRRHLLREMEETPPAAAVADAVEQVKDPGLLSQIWEILKQVGLAAAENMASMPRSDSGMMGGMASEFPSGYDVVKALERTREIPEGSPLDLPEGYEPGSYRAEGDRKVSEVSVGVSRWNILAGTEK